MERQLKEPFLFQELGSIGTLEDKDRDYVQTWVSPEIPGKPIQHALPRIVEKGASAKFRLYTGPKLSQRAKTTVLLTVAGTSANVPGGIRLTVNGRATQQEPAMESSVLSGHSRIPFAADANGFVESYNEIVVTNDTSTEQTINGLELTVRFPKQANATPPRNSGDSH
jgi:hypothetical protein